MKYIPRILSLLLCCMLAGGFCAYGNDKNTKKSGKKFGTIKDSMKVKVSAALPPLAKTTGTVGINTSGSKDAWVQVDLSFRTDNVKEFKSRFLDNPEMEVFIATYHDVPRKPKDPKAKDAKAKDDKSKDGMEKCIVFKGKVKYVALEQDGGEHHMKALLPKIVFRRFAYDRSVDRTIFIAKVVLSSDGRTLGTAYGSNRSFAPKDMVKYFTELPKGYVEVNDCIYGRFGTSWSTIEVNRYELEKIPGHGNMGTEPGGER